MIMLQTNLSASRLLVLVALRSSGL